MSGVSEGGTGNPAKLKAKWGFRKEGVQEKAL